MSGSVPAEGHWEDLARNASYSGAGGDDAGAEMLRELLAFPSQHADLAAKPQPPREHAERTAHEAQAIEHARRRRQTLARERSAELRCERREGIGGHVGARLSDARLRPGRRGRCFVSGRAGKDVRGVDDRRLLLGGGLQRQRRPQPPEPEKPKPG